MSLVRLRPEAPDAGVAHLVERHLAKVEVASSSLVTRSIKRLLFAGAFSMGMGLFWNRFDILAVESVICSCCLPPFLIYTRCARFSLDT